MKEQRVKFIWASAGPAGTRWQLGLFGLHRRSTEGIPDFAYLSERAQRLFQKTTLFISVRGLLAWAGSLAVVAYFLGALAILQIQRRQAHCQITYADLVVPSRWSGLGALRGTAFLMQAKDEFDAGRFVSGFNLLRVGLARKPTDTQARLDLSTLYVRLRLRTQSDRVLLEAFAHGYPGPEFLAAAYAILAEGDNPELLQTFLRKAREAHAATRAPAADVNLIDKLALDAAIRSAHMDEAVRLATQLYPEGSNDRFDVEVKAALAAKDMPRGMALVDEWQRLHPQSDKPMAMAASVYRIAARYDLMDAVIRRLRSLYPTHAGHATFAVIQNWQAGRKMQASAALEDLFFRFGADASALAVLARDLSKVGGDDLLIRVEEVVREHGFDRQAVLVGRLFAQIKARDWEQAVATRERLAEITPRMRVADRLSIDVASTLVTACIDAGGGNQQTFIEAFLRSPGSLEYNRMLIEALIASDRLETAAKLITLVEGSYPDSRYVKDASTRVNEGLRKQTETADSARPVRKESPAGAFEGGAAFLATLERMDAAGETLAASDLIRAVRQANPAWYAGVNEQTYRRELELAIRMNDLPKLQLTVRNYLRGHEARYQPALDLATRWQREGRKTEAMLVAREILKLQPDFQPALVALTNWSPKPLPSDIQPGATTADPTVP